MTTITIPKELFEQGELVLIPRKDYQELLATKLEKVGSVAFTPRQKKAVASARARIKRGDFLTLYEFRKRMGIKG